MKHTITVHCTARTAVSTAVESVRSVGRCTVMARYTGFAAVSADVDSGMHAGPAEVMMTHYEIHCDRCLAL